MNAPKNKKAIFVCAALFVVYISFSDPDGVCITESGDVTGVTNEMRRFVQDKSFWRMQLALAKDEIAAIDKSERKSAEINDRVLQMAFDTRAKELEMYEKYPNSRPSNASIAADELRKKADQIESNELRSTISERRAEKVSSLERKIEVMHARLR